MSRHQLETDLAQLGLGPDAQFPGVKAAFRQAALRFHPDRGGDAARFIRAYAAYRRLCAHFEGREPDEYAARAAEYDIAHEPVDELSENLSALDEAFAYIRQDLMQAEDQWIADIRSQVVAVMNTASQCSEIDAILKNTIKYVTRQFAKEVSNIIESSVGAVAQEFNTWMLSWMTPYYDEVRREFTRRWWRGRAALVLAIGGALVGGWAVLASGAVWISVAAALGCGTGFLLGWPLHTLIGSLRYRAGANVPAVTRPAIYVDKSHMAVVTSAVTDEQIAFGGGLAGLYAFGPWGAIAGLVLGALAGAAFGQEVQERRKIAIEQLDAFLPRACRQIRTILVQQLDQIARNMRAEVTHNYRTARQRAASCVHLLPAPIR